jgi:hypothetical protein
MRLISQHLIQANSADPYDKRALFINPALSSLYNPHILIGMKFFHLGFLSSNSAGIRNNYLSVSLQDIPYLKTGLGLTFCHFSTPVYSKTSSYLSLSKGIFNIIYLGAKLGFIVNGFNESQFDLIHQDDPVFQNGVSKFALSIGSGILLKPLKKIMIGFSINNINTPNISLIKDDVVEPRIYNIDVSYALSFFQLSSGITLMESNIYPNLCINADYWNFGTFYIGYSYSGLNIGNHLNITKKIKLDYQYDYPLSKINSESSGSHQINFTYNLHEPKVPENIFDIYIEKDSLIICNKWFNQEIDQNIPSDIANRRFDQYIPGYNKVVQTINVKSEFVLRYYSKRYVSFFNSLSKYIKNFKSVQIRIVNKGHNVKRAAGMKEFLHKKTGIKEDNISIVDEFDKKKDVTTDNLILIHEETISGRTHQTFLSNDQTQFIISSTNNMRVDSWSLTISQSTGEIVKQFKGKRRIPSKIEWNWIDNKGKLIDVGRYHSTLKWKNVKGREKKSSPKSIVVIKRSQHIDVHVVKAARDFKNRPEIIDIILED